MATNNYYEVERFCTFNRLRIGSVRYTRFRSDGDVTSQVDCVRGCRFRAIIKVVKILMTTGLCDFIELFVALYK